MSNVPQPPSPFDAGPGDEVVDIPSRPDLPTAAEYEPWTPGTTQSPADAQKEQARAAAALPLAREIILWLEACTESYRGVDQIEGVNPASDAEAVKAAMLLSKGMHDEFAEKLKEFSDRFSEYLGKTEPTA